MLGRAFVPYEQRADVVWSTLVAVEIRLAMVPVEYVLCLRRELATESGALSCLTPDSRRFVW
jgi:hypothetical protein